MTLGTALSRRDFVKSAGGLLIGFSFAGPLVDTLQGQAPQPLRPVGPPLARIDSWLRIAPDGAVTVYRKGGDRNGRERRAHPDRCRGTGRAHDSRVDDYGRHLSDTRSRRRRREQLDRLWGRGAPQCRRHSSRPLIASGRPAPGYAHRSAVSSEWRDDRPRSRRDRSRTAILFERQISVKS